MHNVHVLAQRTPPTRWFLGFIAAGLLLGGCATPPPPPPAAAPAVQPLQQYMVEAGQAATEGSKERARELYRTAAKTYPSSKEPWLKLAEDYFEAANYGQAILAAQEVTQRDPADSLATGVLAVSGLRVSAAALSTLRQQQSALKGGTRTEAESLARILRDMLGEPVLVPRPDVVSTPAVTSVPAKPRPPRRSTAAAAPAANAASAPQKPAMPANPFNVLKK
jgi:hypothetical protein